MMEFALEEKTPGGITDAQLAQAVAQSLADCRRRLKKVLLIVPDYTRFHSNAGRIANLYYHLLKGHCEVDLLVALGTHIAMTPAECAGMYGDIPYDRFMMHDWRTGIRHLGQIPGSFVAKVSEGLVNTPIDVAVNEHLWDGYSLILSIGQVVPHEVVGMANHSKNIFVGCGGASMINSSHILGAFYGMERMMGKDFTPVRKVFDYAAEKYLADLPLAYVLTVTTAPAGVLRTHGVYFGSRRQWFEQAVSRAQQTNLAFVDTPFEKAVVYLDEKEYRSTWLGNKSIYRTRMAMAGGGHLVVLAPGVNKFGEDSAIDALIRKYGYCGRKNIIRLSSENEDLQGNLSAAAHLIHGSSDGRFSITYCTRHLTREEVEGVGFGWRACDDAIGEYDPAKLADGYNTLPNGETIYYISNPALGLWATRGTF